MESDQLLEKIKNLKTERKVKQGEFDTHMMRLEQNLKFSRQANTNLKQDYDLLMEKFDKHMKVTNNLNQDLKDEIQELRCKCSKLQIFYDDNQEIL